MTDPDPSAPARRVRKRSSLAAAKALVAERRPDARLARIVDEAVRVAEVDRCTIFVVDAERFLSQIPWTRALRRVPEIAYAHHEKLDGRGHPRGVPAAEIPVESRMMAIADGFDALTGGDRPCSKARAAERALEILGGEARRGQLDGALRGVFVEAGAWREDNRR